MSDDNPRNDPWNDAPTGDEFEMDEEAVYTPAPDEEGFEQDWDDEGAEKDILATDDFDPPEDDVDDSFYEPPEPPITDAELTPEEPPDDDGNWWRENWWRLAIVILLVLAIIFLLARACSSRTKKPTPTPIPSLPTQSTLPTFTPTVAALPTTALESSANGAASETESTPAAPAAQPPAATTAPPAAAGKFTIGQTVIVTGTGKDKLSLRAGPGTDYKRVRVVKDGVKLTVIGGPEEADGFTWWQLKTPKGYVGWAVQDYLTPAQ